MGQREGRLGQKAFQPHPPGAVGGDLGEGLCLSLGVAMVSPFTRVRRESNRMAA